MYFWMIALVLVVTEVLSFATMSIIKKEFYTYSDFADTKFSRLEMEKEENYTLRTQNSRRALHPYLGYVLESDDRSIEDGADRIDMAALGFIFDSGEMVLNPNDNEVVVAIFGGSVAEMFSRVSGSGIDILTSHLRSIPHYSDKEFTFVLHAMGGYKQPQQLLALSYFLSLGAVYDIIINIDGFNEIVLPQTENVPKGVDPFYPRGWYFLSEKEIQMPFQELIAQISILKRNRATLAQQFNRVPIRYSYFLTLLWHTRDHFIANDLTSLRIQLGDMHSSTQLKYSVSGPERIYEHDADLIFALSAEWQRSSLQMHRLSTANDIRYYHFLQPNQYVKGSKQHSMEEAKMDGKYKKHVEVGYPILREAGETLVRSGVHFKDMTMVFSDYPENIYIDDCCHFSPKGNTLLGDAIGRFISEDLRRSEL